jgi:hypothetical protein
MQHIPDNEFDRLFREGLVDAEVTPSASVWDRIEPQIPGKSKRRSAYYWSAAATVLLGLTAGLLFIQRPDRPVVNNTTAEVQLKDQGLRENLQEKSDAGAAKAEVSADVLNGLSEQVESASKGISDETIDLEVVHVAENDGVSRSTGNAFRQSSAVSQTKYSNADDKKSLIAMQPDAAQAHPIITKPVQEVETPTDQAIETPAAELALTANAADAREVEAITEKAPQETLTRTRIRNAGDLVNFVVEKLDKREEKIVEFRTDDDDNSSLVAINIGPFKINQRRHK